MIEKRQTKAGQVRYEVRFRGSDGRERSRTFRTGRKRSATSGASRPTSTRASGSIPATAG